MTQVQLQVRPRRVRCDRSAEPPPFRFAPTGERASQEPTGARAVAMLPLRGVAFICTALGRTIDLAFFLVVLTVWCALHLLLWSYAFDMGPAADCAGLPCPGWVADRVLFACAGLAALTFAASRLLKRLEHKATSNVLLLLVTFDVAAFLLLAGNKLAS